MRTRPVRAAGAALRGGFAAIRGHLDHCLRRRALCRLATGVGQQALTELTAADAAACARAVIYLVVVAATTNRCFAQAEWLGHLVRHH